MHYEFVVGGNPLGNIHAGCTECFSRDNSLPGRGMRKNEGPVRLDVKRELVASIKSNGTHDV